MKASEIVTLAEAYEMLRTKKLPIKVSLILSRDARKLADATRDIEEKRSEIVDKYGDKDEMGGLIVKDGRVHVSEEGRKELDELFDTEIEVFLDTISIEDLDQCDGDRYDPLTLEEVDSLSYIIAS